MSSLIWEKFTKLVGEKRARCNICKKKYTYDGASTKGLWDHLNSMHKKEHETLKKRGSSMADDEESDTQAPANKVIFLHELMKIGT